MSWCVTASKKNIFQHSLADINKKLKDAAEKQYQTFFPHNRLWNLTLLSLSHRPWPLLFTIYVSWLCFTLQSKWPIGLFNYYNLPLQYQNFFSLTVLYVLQAWDLSINGLVKLWNFLYMLNDSKLTVLYTAPWATGAWLLQLIFRGVGSSEGIFFLGPGKISYFLFKWFCINLKKPPTYQESNYACYPSPPLPRRRHKKIKKIVRIE
jgi:hypothetical protein